MKKLVSIVGTRPQFIKLAPLCTELVKHNDIIHEIIHTGQHYDLEMSENIFRNLKLPQPKYLLDKQGNTIIEPLASMMVRLEKILLEISPDYVLVYGDCDTTIVGTITANKLGFKVVHIEAGMRSYNKSMPEEINRILTDHLSDVLLCSTMDSIEKLKSENITNNVHYVGNLQLDLFKMSIASYDDETVLAQNGLQKNKFVLLTIHRHYNTTMEKLTELFSQLNTLDDKIIFPVHPRTRKLITSNRIAFGDNIIPTSPVNYLDMTILERYCKYIITDSGGVQPEAWFLGKKCIIMRPETEWVETLKNNNNILYDWSTELKEFIDNFLNLAIHPISYQENCAQNIVNILKNDMK